MIKLLNNETPTFNGMLSKSNDTHYSCKKYSKTNDLILQISLWCFGSHNEQSLYKKCNLRSCRVTLFLNPKTKDHCTDMVAYKTAQLSSALPARYRNLSSLDLFKCKIKKNWHYINYYCISVKFLLMAINSNYQEVYLSIDEYSCCVRDRRMFLF